MISKNIHLVFLRKDEPFPSIFIGCMQRIKDFHTDWSIQLYNEDDAQEIVQKHLPQFLHAYNSFKHNVQKADFLRIALVYIYGGFYMDLDMLCLKSLDDLLDNNLILAEEKTISVEEQHDLNLKHRLRIANYMFGGEAGHPFWMQMMKEMVARANVSINSQQDILDKTGPGLLTDFYHDSRELYTEIHLLRNTDKKCVQPYHNEIACHFGEYAAHLHTGTWRREIQQ